MPEPIKTMKCMRLNGSGAGATLLEGDAPRPAPGAGEVVVRVFAAGVTPTEIIWYPSLHNAGGKERKGAVPAHEFSGEIAQVGDGVAAFTIGKEVFGMNDWFEDGALAEYCLSRPEWLAPKPKRLSHVEAASIPIGALTAWQGLFDRAKLQAGERLLVHGGAGGVGVFAIQLARRRGASVVATVSANNAEFVRQLGADEVIDYRAAPFETVVRNVDVVFDAVGGDTLRRSWAVLKPNGRLITIAAEAEAAADKRVKEAFFIVEPKHEQLVEIGRLLDAGELRPFVDRVVPLAEAANAYTGKIERTGRGKVVVAVRGESSSARGAGSSFN